MVGFCVVSEEFEDKEKIEDLDFASLMTVVAEKVARKVRVIKKTGKPYRQIPCTVSTLRKKIYFPKLTKNQMPPSCDDNQSDEDDS